jgi:hypothetical protein
MVGRMGSMGSVLPAPYTLRDPPKTTTVKCAYDHDDDEEDDELRLPGRFKAMRIRRP